MRLGNVLVLFLVETAAGVHLERRCISRSCALVQVCLFEPQIRLIPVADPEELVFFQRLECFTDGLSTVFCIVNSFVLCRSDVEELVKHVTVPGAPFDELDDLEVGLLGDERLVWFRTGKAEEDED